MLDFNSIEYYASRERRERELADASADLAISAIHLEMATRYAELISNPLREVRTALVR